MDGLASISRNGVPPEFDSNKSVDDAERISVEKGPSQVATTSTQENKRSKTSRACDKCREKKTKCDFDEDNNATCTMCQKLGKSCTFARAQMKRGPVKGYTRHTDVSETSESSRRGSRKRSVSESLQDDGARSIADPVSLPPLNQYWPQNPASITRNHHVLAPGSQPQTQPQFWKVPYREYQHQRRDSVDSLISNTSNRRNSEQMAYPGSNASSTSPFYSMGQYHLPLQPPNSTLLDSDPNLSSSPVLQRTPSIHGKSSQYPYSQFNNVTTQQQQPTLQQPYLSIQNHLQNQSLFNNQHFKDFDQGFSSRKNSNVSVALSPSSSLQIPPPQAPAIISNDNEEAAKDNSTQVTSQNDTFASQQQSIANPKEATKASVAPSRKNTRRSTSNRSVSQSSVDTHNTSNHSIDTYGKIPDTQLIDIYYEFIHPTFPVIPVNKRTLTDDLLLINTQPVSGIHELNCHILHWFRNSLELLVRVALKKPSGSAYDYSDGVVDVFDSQVTFIAALNESFQTVVDIHPTLKENENILSSKIKFIYLATYTILNYILAFVGYDNSFVLGMSVTIYNELKLFRCLVYDDEEEELGEQETATESDSKNTSSDGTQLLFKRLYVLLVVFDSLQSCTFGVPKLMSVPLLRLIEECFAYDTGKWGVEYDNNSWKNIYQSLLLGHALSQVSTSRTCMSQNLGKAWYKMDQHGQSKDSPTGLFVELLNGRHELVQSYFALTEMNSHILLELCHKTCGIVTTMRQLLTAVMKANPTNSIDPNNRPPAGTSELIHNQEKLPAPVTNSSTSDSEMYRKLLGLNAGDTIDLRRGSISPFVVAMVVEVSNFLELIKNLPTMLISLILQGPSQTGPSTGLENDVSNSQDAVLALSNAMSDLCQITSLLGVLKPHKMFELVPRVQRADFKAHTRRVRYKYALGARKTGTTWSATWETSLEPFSDAIWGLFCTEELGWL
ncbi:LADA_0G12288g1_1 [Lachancea dasiensis]|uniref:LADA_0G12288g1_1 n=1 Tax=Lachancea dasiensis TaxID=1072105 RepID=A0A1G4JV79_9SACH|nr:LADA_0G12288g1_1 [Lachancea dasiensis]